MEKEKMVKENLESYYFAEHDEGCKHGQQCTRYHKMLKPEERRCYVCGSKAHMAGECDRPKKDDPPVKGSPKGDKGKDGKGKAKGKSQDAGKGSPQINKVDGEATKSERELTQQDSNPKSEPDAEPPKQLEEFQKAIKMLKEREPVNNPSRRVREYPTDFEEES